MKYYIEPKLFNLYTDSTSNWGFESAEMPIPNVDEFILNLKLASYTGLHQMIHPSSGTRKVLGYNVYHVFVMAYMVFVAITLALIPIGMYLWDNDIGQIAMGLILLGNYAFSIYKVVIVMRNSREIWDCVRVTRFDFLSSYGGYRTDVLKLCSIRSNRITYTYSVCCYAVLVLWYMTPFMLRNSKITIKYRDGTYHNYRMNVHNLYVPVSSSTYNEYFLCFYVLEVMFGLCYIFFSVMFENYVVSMCLAISSQVETIGKAFESLGHKFKMPSTIGT